MLGVTPVNHQLYAWQPNGHGSDSFFVVAASEAEARHAVERYLAQGSADGAPIDAYGWGTSYYTLTVADPGVVLTNENS